MHDQPETTDNGDVKLYCAGCNHHGVRTYLRGDTRMYRIHNVVPWSLNPTPCPKAGKPVPPETKP